MVELRWIVDEGTSTKEPVLQYRNWEDGSDVCWHDVPMLTKSEAKAEDEAE